MRKNKLMQRLVAIEEELLREKDEIRERREILSKAIKERLKLLFTPEEKKSAEERRARLSPSKKPMTLEERIGRLKKQA